MSKSLFVPLLVVCMILVVLTAAGKSTPQATPPPEPISPLPIGVIFPTNAHDNGWIEAQLNGFQALPNTMDVALLYKEDVSDQDDSVKLAVDELVEDGAKVIFVTSYDYGTYMQDCAKKYPEIMFFHAGGVKTASNLSTVLGRVYQARYLTGLVAGLQTKTNHLGFIASYPIPEVIRGINAFTLGVRAINSQAVVHVTWTGHWNNEEAETQAVHHLFDEYPIDLLTQHQNTPTPVKVVDSLGKPEVYAIGHNSDSSTLYPNTFLTSVIWDWEAFYQARIEEYMIGQFVEKRFFEGLETGLLDIAPLAPFAHPDCPTKVQEARSRMLEGSWDVFYGPIWDNEGRLRVAADETLSDNYLLEKMDWFVEGVEVEPSRDIALLLK